MGTVYRATARDGTVVALKVAKESFVPKEESARRFVREARAAGHVRHRHLVGVIDAGEVDGRRYLAMSLVVGRSLDERIRAEGPLPLADTARVTRHVAAGLDALHAAGLVHRDVKPSNIMIDADSAAALTDFGLAKGDDYSKITKAGEMMGTIDYVAPELIRGDQPSPASDLYALGCVVYECIAGDPPFAGKSGVLQVGLGHLDEEPPDPCARRLDLAPDVLEVVLLALAKDPAARPAARPLTRGCWRWPRGRLAVASRDADARGDVGAARRRAGRALAGAGRGPRARRPDDRRPGALAPSRRHPAL